MRETLIKDCIILKLYCKFNSLYMCVPYEDLYILKSIEYIYFMASITQTKNIHTSLSIVR